MSVLLYGATGFTGRLVAQVLTRRGIRFVVAGRDRHRVRTMAASLADDVEFRVARVHDTAQMAAAIAGNKLVINCAGPFAAIGEHVVRASIDAGVHYIDTAREQIFLRRIYERYESAARRANVAVVNGCAFEIALGDWAAAKAAAGFDAECDDLFVAYAVDQFRATPGTEMSALDSLGHDGVMWNIDRWESVKPAAEQRRIRFPAPFGERVALSFPSGEVISVPRHSPSRRMRTYLSLSGDSRRDNMFRRAATTLGPALPLLLRSPLLTALKARVGQTGDGPTAVQRHDSTFAVVAEAEHAFKRHRVCITGCDPYGVTAEIIGYAAQHLLNKTDKTKPSGVLAPTELIDPATALAEVAEQCLLEVTTK